MLQISKALFLSLVLFSNIAWAHSLPIINEFSELTVLNLSDAENVFNDIVKNNSIPFDFPDGCQAKAQKISMLLEKKGIITVKAFVEGHIYNQSHWGLSFWLFHVASLILIQANEAKEVYVIDPYLMNKLMTYSEWIHLLSKDPRTKIQKKYFTNRFVYDPLDLLNNPVSYSPELIHDMEVVFKQIRKRLERH